jgi:hypothetical protein
MSPEDSNGTRLDRVEFKLSAAHFHLNNLISLQDKFVDNNMNDNVSNQQIEVEIDCFLAQVIAAIDALLVQINNDLGLGIGIEKVDLSTVQSALNAKTKDIDLLSELHRASDYNNWMWLLRKLRNETLYKNLMSGNRQKLTLKLDENVDMELVEYFEKALQSVRALVSGIRSKEPLLTRTPHNL